jgi:plastocyanin
MRRLSRGWGNRARRLLAAAALAAAALLLASPAQAGFIVTQVSVDDPPQGAAFAFTPDRVDLDVGADARVGWTRVDGGDAKHSITQADGLFRMAPTLGEIDYTRHFSAGTFRYFCEIHGSPGRGMDGVVRVAPSEDVFDDPDPPFFVRWGNEESRETGDVFDVRFRRQGASRWTVWKERTSRHQGFFGGGDRPVAVVPGRVYEFQARSLKSRAPEKRSGWSPVLVVEVDP